MVMQQTIQPLNVAGATLLIQLLLLGMLTITSSLHRVRSNSSKQYNPIGKPPFPRNTLIVFVFLMSFAALLICDELYGVWSPLFNGSKINTISAASAINIVFILDILLIGLLMSSTGGSHDSPFTPALFMVPSLAIFLRVTPTAFVVYAVVAGLVYLFLLMEIFREEVASNRAIGFMGIACLALSMFTGYITRPVPIEQLSIVGERFEIQKAAPSIAPLELKLELK